MLRWKVWSFCRAVSGFSFSSWSGLSFYKKNIASFCLNFDEKGTILAILVAFLVGFKLFLAIFEIIKSFLLLNFAYLTLFCSINLFRRKFD
jgi:uncharacterized protein YacL